MVGVGRSAESVGGSCARTTDDADRHLDSVRRHSEPIVRQMGSTVDRPIVMPLSNPTSKAEAVPTDLIRGPTGGRLSRRVVRLPRSSTTGSPTASRRRTTHSCSPASGSA